MYSKEELENLINSIASKTESNRKAVEVESIIAQIKAEILQNVGKKIALLTMVEMMGKSTATDAISEVPVYASGDHVAYQIAEAAEMIMRRAWIEKK